MNEWLFSLPWGSVGFYGCTTLTVHFGWRLVTGKMEKGANPDLEALMSIISFIGMCFFGMSHKA